MKKVNMNQNGFSLIELIIVVAILAALSAVSIILFGGILDRNKEKSDDALAGNIKKALQLYISDSGDTNLTGLSLPPNETLQHAANRLETRFVFNSTTYGPYLNCGKITPSKYTGFIATINSTTGIVSVVTSTSVAVNSDDSLIFN